MSFEGSETQNALAAINPAAATAGIAVAEADAPAVPLLAIRPAERMPRTPSETVMRDVRALLEAAGVGADLRQDAVLTTPLGHTACTADTDPVTIGRHPDAAIVVMDSLVSRQHCIVSSTPNGVVLTDLESTNGTWVRRAGQQIVVHPGTAVRLQHGDVLCCEDLDIAVVAIRTALA